MSVTTHLVWNLKFILWIDDLKSMTLQSFQFSLRLDDLGFSEYLWKLEDAWRLPFRWLQFGNKLAPRCSVGNGLRKPVSIAMLTAKLKLLDEPPHTL